MQLTTAGQIHSWILRDGHTAQYLPYSEEQERVSSFLNSTNVM